MPLTHFFPLFAVLILAIGAVFDLRTGQLPNWLTFGGLLLGLLGHGAAGYVAVGMNGLGRGLAYAAAGTLVCAALPYLIFRVSGMGGGDVKLLAALGALCGPSLGIAAEFYAFFMLALFVTARLTYAGVLLKTAASASKLALRPFSARARQASIAPELTQTVRGGPAFLAGLLLAVMFGG